MVEAVNTTTAEGQTQTTSNAEVATTNTNTGNFVTREQLAATLRLMTQIQQDTQQQQQPPQVERETSTPEAENAEKEAVKVLQAQLAKLEQQATQSKLDKQLSELAAKYKLDAEGVEYLRGTLGNRLSYNEATGFYTKDGKKTLEDVVSEFSTSNLGKRFVVKDKPTLPEENNKVKATGTKAGEKPNATDLLMEAFKNYIR